MVHGPALDTIQQPQWGLAVADATSRLVLSLRLQPQTSVAIRLPCDHDITEAAMASSPARPKATPP